MKKKIETFKYPLMDDNITKEDINKLSIFLKKLPRLTSGEKVKLFEKKWSKWLGVKYSVFVNSGSSANLLTIAALKIFSNKRFKNKKEIIVPPLTWNSDILSVIRNGYKPVFCDVNFSNLSMNLNEVKKKINKNTLAVFLSHIQGFNGLDDEFINFLRKKKVYLIEDVCESHGAAYKKQKCGTFGLASNFSFYYGHHMTTIEGGMICTDDKNFYDICCSLRGHGMLRESPFKSIIKKFTKKHKDLNPKFIFINEGFNFRNNEIGAVLGINQIKRLNANIKKRNENFLYFQKNIDADKYYNNYDTKGISNYAFPIILKTKRVKIRNRFEKYLKKFSIEFRRGNAGGGNQLRQPYLKKFSNFNKKNFMNVEHIHFFGYYIGNFPTLKFDKLKRLLKIINDFKF